MSELVLSNNGKPVTNSLLVAEKFGKQHRDVLRTIRNIIEDTTAQNCAVLEMFLESTYFNEQGKQQPMYVMNRDGFSLLVMGFTGKEAMKFKIDFINAFNQIEAQLKAIHKPQSTLDILKLTIQSLEEQQRGLDEVKQQVLELKAATITRPEYFTIMGYATLNHIKVGLQLAATLGSKASRICKQYGYPMDELPDPRFGRVKVYPKSVLQQVFNEAV